ncbi:MAG: hypothetical protein JSU94_06495 [Phycisphaerales bacterium]|nr:MAG: hypothetical protein JSU94_06495 [Phycisphaerales bacterium]
MSRKLTRTRRPLGLVNTISLLRFILAAIVYAAFTIYLYHPHLKDLQRWQYLLIVNPCIASLGAYVLSRRWIAAFSGSFFAGAIYGFGPFSLGLAKFHPTAGLLAASIPWLFCPAAFGPRTRLRLLSPVLVILPFLAVVVFFQAAGRYRLFAASTQARLQPADLVGLLVPLVIIERNVNTTLIGFYHVPVAALIMGSFMLLAARRVGILAIIVLATALACWKSFLGVSPVLWLAIPVLCCSVLIGAGMQGFASAGYADRKYVLLAAIILGILAIVALMLATKYFQTFLGLGSKYAKIFVEAAKMYILGATSLAIIFFMERAKLRLGPVRWAILCTTAALDMFLNAGFIVDRVL